MARPWSMRVGAINLSAGEAAPEPSTPFRVVLLGDFSGRRWQQAEGADLGQRRPVLVDPDNFEEVFARFNVQVRLPVAEGGATSLPVFFRELEDFHPDRLFDRLDVFQTLRDLRRRLDDPATAAAAAAEVRSWSGAPAPAKGTGQPAPGQLSPAELLRQMIGEEPGAAEPTPPPAESGDWNAFLRRIAQEHAVPGTDPSLTAQVDEATSALMRGVLHDPAFQALEAAWRAVDLLVRRAGTDNNVKLYLLDVSKDELAADLAAEDLRSSALYRLLVERTVETPGAEPWAVLAGNYTFDRTADDALLLASLGVIAAQAGAPFLAAAHSRLVGCPSLVETPDPRSWTDPGTGDAGQAWQELRRFPQAAYLGLALPRFLTRLPYGRETSSTERFDFEEMSEARRHDAYLWGNPAFACVLLLAEAFSRQGWEMRPGALLELDGLPLHTYREDGESTAMPCAEVVLTDRAAGAILERGLMPLQSLPRREAVRLARFQSLAEGQKPLAGRWG